MLVIIKNNKLNREFMAEFDTKEQCDIWVKNHKLKGKDRVIIRSDKKLNGFKILLEDINTNGKVEYVLEGPCEYEVEYIHNNPVTVEEYKKELCKEIKKLLIDTDWSQLADAEISTEERRLYKEYRKYIRRKTKEYNDETIQNWKILSYKEYVRMKYPR